jgi:S1-C subfamily serine protease
VLAVVFCVAVTALLGALVGHAIWQTANSNQGLQSTGNSSTPTFHYSNPGGSTGGSSGSSGSTSAVASKVDPGLVDVNTVLSYEDVEGAGTGMVLTSNGLVLTNNHVVEGATSISVTDIGNGRTYSATVLGYDRTADVALIQLTGASGLSTVDLSTSAASVGQQIVAIGNAGGTGGTPSVAAGTVTATDQSITASDEATGTSEQLTGLIESNADIVAGDSGGPLVNESGQVLGMDTAAADSFQFQSSQNQGYSIPISTAAAIAKKIETGTTASDIHIGATAFLGVDVESASAAGTGSSGAAIAEVLPGTPASSANLQAGDTITAVSGVTITSPESLTTVILSKKPGDTVSVVYTDASGSQETVNVQLGTGPPQ